MDATWKDIVTQRIKQGMTDEQIAVETPLSIVDIKHTRLTMKQQEFEESEECEHDYAVLYDNIDIEELRYTDGDVEIEVRGYAVFHCKKCLDVQKKVF